jgi:hypothetical protein
MSLFLKTKSVSIRQRHVAIDDALEITTCR